jgi:D-alanyl-lipoteichoic acid acyltransferase DltB (MBOAT superfamily)
VIPLFNINRWVVENFRHLTWEQVQSWFVFDSQKPLLFNSALFLGLFLVFYFFYILTQKTHRLRIAYVVAFSLFFYYKSSGIFFLLIIFSSILDYVIAKLIYDEKSNFYRKFYLIVSLLVNLVLLGYFKYTNFFIDNTNLIFDRNFELQEIILPVGISFYTFQTLSYTIDVYRKQLEPTKSFIDFLFFVSFFPQLVAGPIVRASDFIPQIYKRLNLTKEEFNAALFLIVGGLLKKAVISDYISINFVDRVFDAPSSYTSFENLMASYGYAIQIYCDFSGYSDMAIGLALLMGFWLPPNFRTPYQSASITEFWRRWHISLSTWFRDYLYIPLGGNKVSKSMLYRNLFIVFFATGLWHGASWNFIIWGMLHGVFIVLERLFLEDALKKVWQPISHIYTLLVVMIGWVFFRADTLSHAILYLKKMFYMLPSDNNTIFYANNFMNVQNVIIGILAIIFSFPIFPFIKKKFAGIYETSKVLQLCYYSGLIVLLYIVMMYLSVDTYNPFIYFRF